MRFFFLKRCLTWQGGIRFHSIRIARLRLAAGRRGFGADGQSSRGPVLAARLVRTSLMLRAAHHHQVYRLLLVVAVLLVTAATLLLVVVMVMVRRCGTRGRSNLSSPFNKSPRYEYSLDDDGQKRQATGILSSESLTVCNSQSSPSTSNVIRK